VWVGVQTYWFSLHYHVTVKYAIWTKDALNCVLYITFNFKPSFRTTKVSTPSTYFIYCTIPKSRLQDIHGKSISIFKIRIARHTWKINRYLHLLLFVAPGYIVDSRQLYFVFVE
jgi:hypothetical protein